MKFSPSFPLTYLSIFGNLFFYFIFICVQVLEDISYMLPKIIEAAVLLFSKKE